MPKPFSMLPKVYIADMSMSCGRKLPLCGAVWPGDVISSILAAATARTGRPLPYRAGRPIAGGSRGSGRFDARYYGAASRLPADWRHGKSPPALPPHSRPVIGLRNRCSRRTWETCRTNLGSGQVSTWCYEETSKVRMRSHFPTLSV